MRILAIRGRNLASLEGDFELDFRKGPLAEGGLFAITGPTGAGKSTLLDALCLALFDRTPRLDGRGGVLIGSEGETDDEKVRSSDVRSLLRRGAAEGKAEVDFVGRDGREWRATWSVRRARGKAKGKLQDQAVALVDLATGDPVPGRKTETLKAIEEKVGLTFDQFRQSVLLAQGEFARFLKGDANERAQLLERMTGTEIYTRISVAAHEKRRTTAEAVKVAEAALEGVRVLGVEERAEAEAGHDAAAAGAVAARGRLEALEELARGAAKRGELAQRSAAREKEEAEARRALAEATGRRGAAETLKAQAAEALAAVTAAGLALEPEIARARELDGALAAEARGLETARLAARDAAKRAAAERAEAAAAAERARSNRVSVEASERRLAERAAAKPLVARRDLWTRGLEELERLGGERAAWSAKREGAARAEARAREKVDAAVSAIAESSRLLGEKRAEHERVAAECLEAFALETRRAALVAGEPCPLCGATEHPWAGREPGAGAAGDGPGPRLAELEREKALRGELAALEARKERLEGERRVAEAAVLTASSLAGEAGRQLEGIAKREGAEHERLEEVLGGREALRERVASDARGVREALAAEAEDYAGEEARLAEGRAVQAGLDAAAAEAEAKAKAAGDEAGRADSQAAGKAETHAAIAAQRGALLSGRPVAEVDGERKRSEKEAAEAAERARTASDAAGLAFARAEQRVAEAARLAAEARGAEEEAAKALAAALSAAGLPDETALAAARSDASDAAAAALDRRTEAELRLRQDDEARILKAGHGEKLAAAQREAKVWGELGAVIGHHDGAELRRFAQGLTLDALVAHANAHLAELAKRYRLERVPKADLDLMVVDEDMGGETRSVHSLSGGETFLVSLALALGLSSLATRKTRIESLFVDEGFGALDPRTLDTALAVLETLRAGGRRVGVISHVPGLSERIGVRVAVTPMGGGRSRVEVSGA
ncbi:MAG: AAA family ATPase [Thermoanaerobaculia bacterium]